MDKQIYKLLNQIHTEVNDGQQIDEPTYNMYAKNVRVDRSPASLARIRENMKYHRINLQSIITSPINREIILLQDDDIKISEHFDSMALMENTILVIALVQNFESTSMYIEQFIISLQSHFKTVYFYFGTYNNTDNTTSILQSLCNRYPDICQGTYFSDVPFEVENKCFKAHLRNQCYQNAKTQFGSGCDYLIYLDHVAISKPINIDGVITSFALAETWDIICGNRVFQNSSYHSDVFDLRLIGDSTNILEKYKYFESFVGKSLYWIDKFYSFETWYKVDAAFGGIMILQNKIFNLDKLWDEDDNDPNLSINISLCTKFLNVYVNPSLRFEQHTQVEGILYHNPSIFIPSDTDFCGGMNMYITALMSGCRIYPYYNKEIFMEKNTTLQHFTYLDDTIDNCWFEYF